LRVKIAKGERIGRARLGYVGKKGSKVFTRDPKTWPAIERILELHKEGVGATTISRTLWREEYRTAKGAHIGESVVRLAIAKEAA